MSRPRILVAGIGNIFLGDDAFGVEVVRQLKTRPWPDNVRIVDFGIRGLDLTYALLDGYEAVVLVDALPRGGAPGSIYLIEPALEDEGKDEPISVEGHNLDPVRVLRLASAMGSTVRRLLVVGCEPGPPGELEEMADGLSEPVRAAIPEAVATIETVIEQLLRTDESLPKEATPCPS